IGKILDRTDSLTLFLVDVVVTSTAKRCLNSIFRGEYLEKQWFCLRTIPRKERLAFHCLGQARIRAILPMRPVIRYGKPVPMPKFPGYLFALLPPNGGRQWDLVCEVRPSARVPGLQQQPFLMSAGCICAVDSAVVQEACRDEQRICVTEPRPMLVERP